MALFPRNENHGGVLRAPREKTGFVKYASIYLTHFWKLLALNFIYFVFCIPIITIGPATAAMTKVCRNYYQERHAYLFADFWKAFKQNFKQGVVFGLINTIFAAGFLVGIPFYWSWAKEMPMMYAPMFISIAFMLVLIMMSGYIFIMVSSTNLKVKQILKNSFILVYLGLKRSLAFLVIYVALMSLLLLFFPVSLIFAAIFPFSFIAYVDCSCCYPIVRKYIIQPYYDQRGEENPEDVYLDTHDERVFVDTPEYVTDSQRKAKKKKMVIK